MPIPAHETAAQFLFAARKRGTPGPRIPTECRPSSVADALAVQQRMITLIGDPIGGWKCSVPSEARPVLAAPIFAPTIRTTSPCPVIGSGGTAKIEPEIAFVLGRDLPARATRYSEGEIRAAVREARLVLEIMGTRYEDPASIDFPELLADNVANQGLYVGPVVDDAFNRSLETFTVTVQANGSAHSTHDGTHPDAHPLRPLYWLANHLAATATPLRAGQIVTTGSYCGVLDVPIDQALTIRYGDLGTLSVTLMRAA